MSIDFIRPEVDELRPRISVIGVGGAGGNAIANMIASEVQGVDFIVANTDAQALTSSKARRVIQMGTQVTGGLGAGSQPEVGRAAAEEAIDVIRDHLTGAHMVPPRQCADCHVNNNYAITNTTCTLGTINKAAFDDLLFMKP